MAALSETFLQQDGPIIEKHNSWFTRHPAISQLGRCLTFDYVYVEDGVEMGTAVASSLNYTKGESVWPSQYMTLSFWFRTLGIVYGSISFRSESDNNYFQPGMDDNSYYMVLQFLMHSK